MDYTRLENNIMDVIKEEQVKLGYRSETIRLYYTFSSLNHLLGQTETPRMPGNLENTLPQENAASLLSDPDKMLERLQEFCEKVSDRLGAVQVSRVEKERFCFLIPPKGVDYVHLHLKSSDFICEFIHTIERHGCSIEEVFSVFRKHSSKVHIEKVTHGEFDYLVYFEDGIPDAFRYCLTDEGGHIIYHRFTEEDYKDFDFGVLE